MLRAGVRQTMPGRGRGKQKAEAQIVPTEAKKAKTATDSTSPSAVIQHAGTGVVPLGRLWPSSIRQLPDANGRLPHPDDERIPLDINSTSELERLYLVHTGGPGSPLFVQILSANNLQRLSLPMMAQGRPDALRALKEEDRAYELQPLIRVVSPTDVFQHQFGVNKFSETKHIIVVPILSKEEEVEYKTLGWKEYGAKYFQDSTWLAARTYWICDGATRWTLCVKSLFLSLFVGMQHCLPHTTHRFNFDLRMVMLYPHVPELVAKRFAAVQNEGVSDKNPTGYLVGDMDLCV